MDSAMCGTDYAPLPATWDPARVATSRLSAAFLRTDVSRASAMDDPQIECALGRAFRGDLRPRCVVSNPRVRPGDHRNTRPVEEHRCRLLDDGQQLVARRRSRQYSHGSI